MDGEGYNEDDEKSGHNCADGDDFTTFNKFGK